MQTYAFAKDFSHFYLWTVKRLQKAVWANSPHLRQFANRAPSSLILTIQQTTSPLNSHGDPNFQQLNSIYILRKRLQETALTPLHTRSHCERTGSRRIHGLLTAPQTAGIILDGILSGCATWKERREGSRPEQTWCAPHRRDQEWEACGSWTSECTNSSRPGMVTLPQRWQHSRGATKRGGRQELEEKDHSHLPKEIQLARFPSPQVWKGCLVLTRHDLLDPSMKISEKKCQTS